MEAGLSWVEILWTIVLTIAVAGIGWIVRTLGMLKDSCRNQIELLKWLRTAHEEDDTVTAQILPLLERNIRLAKTALETIRWHAEQSTGRTPPPGSEGE